MASNGALEKGGGSVAPRGRPLVPSGPCVNHMMGNGAAQYAMSFETTNERTNERTTRQTTTREGDDDARRRRASARTSNAIVMSRVDGGDGGEEATASLERSVRALTRALGLDPEHRFTESLASASTAMLGKMISKYDVTKVAVTQSRRTLSERSGDPEAFARECERLKALRVEELDRYLAVMAKIASDDELVFAVSESGARAAEAEQELVEVDGEADRPRLVGERAQHPLADPVRGVRGEAVAALGPEAPDRLEQAQRALLHQILHRQRAAGDGVRGEVRPDDGDDEAHCARSGEG